MFQFGRFPSYNYVFIVWSMILHHRGFPIRKSTGRSLFAAHRSLSQLVTSFFGSWCQGIPFMLLLAWTSVYCLSNISVLSLELLCITFLQLLNYFALAKLNFLPFLERPDFKLICYRLSFSLFALFKSVRVLKFILLIRFSMNIRLLSPALFQSRLSGFITTQIPLLSYEGW